LEDQLLENLYADEADITVEEAANEIESLLRFQVELNRLKSIQLPGFGTMKRQIRTNIFLC
jgi:nucleoid DNA-binding protein